MTGATHQCPHCEQSFQVQHITLHTAICMSNPEMYARVAAALPAESDPTRITPSAAWERKARELGLPSGGFLKRLYGGGWGDVAAEFGLHTEGKTERVNKNWESDLEEFVRDCFGRQATIEDIREHALPAREGWRVVPRWDVATASWQPAYAQQVYLLR